MGCYIKFRARMTDIEYYECQSESEPLLGTCGPTYAINKTKVLATMHMVGPLV